MAPSFIFVEDRPAPLDATSDPPSLFDGTTRLIFNVASFMLLVLALFCSLLDFPYVLTSYCFVLPKVVHKLRLPICSTSLDHSKLQGLTASPLY
jgi:hypothetical protein